ncbi:MAG: hypothetical protein MRY57_03355 [Candidatus Pacebacteria bacterium]|nr:hypothetical protein [Candidatus Paceibacterota bacterium]
MALLSTLYIHKFEYGNFQIYEISETDYDKEPFEATIVMYKNTINITFPDFEITNCSLVDTDVIELELTSEKHPFIYKQINMKTGERKHIPVNESHIAASYQKMFEISDEEQLEMCIQQSFCLSEEITIPKA